MPEIKITIVGGGSYNWSPILLCDLMHEEELAGSEVILYDINLQAASEIKVAMARIAKDNGKDFTFTATDKDIHHIRPMPECHHAGYCRADGKIKSL